MITAVPKLWDTRYRIATVDNHCTSTYHQECVKLEKATLTSVSVSKPIAKPIAISILNSEKQLADYVGKLLIQVFVDAKLLTVAAYNWPPRYVANEVSQRYCSQQDINTNNIPLQYVSPVAHLDLMSSIVSGDCSNMKNKLSSCLAISLRMDGSIDQKQKDKIYVLASITNTDGGSENIFLGMDEQVESGAAGLLKTALRAIENNFSENFMYQHILNKVSSICTDGANVNKGEKKGLWKLLDDEIKIKTNSRIPLIKIWCSVHRSDLVFNDLTKSITEISSVLSTLNKIATYFHSSSLRSAQLKLISEQYGTQLKTMPKLFEVRWVQFTHQLVRAVLESWNTIILYCQKYPDAQSNGFHTFLINIDKLKQITFIGDLTFLFKRFQKKLQATSLTLPKLSEEVNLLISSIDDMVETPILDGYEHSLEKSVIIDGDKMLLKDIELEKGRASRATAFNFNDFRSNTASTLKTFLNERLVTQNAELIEVMKSFLKFDESVDIGKVHEMLGSDLNGSNLHIQYMELKKLPDIKKLAPRELAKYLAAPERKQFFYETLIILSRILALSPNSADCERTVSANNSLKTNKRSSLSIETENKYLYVHFNASPLENGLVFN